MWCTESHQACYCWRRGIFVKTAVVVMTKKSPRSTGKIVSKEGDELRRCFLNVKFESYRLEKSKLILPRGAGAQLQRQPQVEMNLRGSSLLLPRKPCTSLRLVLWAAEGPGPGGTIARID